MRRFQERHTDVPGAGAFVVLKGKSAVRSTRPDRQCVGFEILSRQVLKGPPGFYFSMRYSSSLWNSAKILQETRNIWTLRAMLR